MDERDSEVRNGGRAQGRSSGGFARDVRSGQSATAAGGKRWTLTDGGAGSGGTSPSSHAPILVERRGGTGLPCVPPNAGLLVESVQAFQLVMAQFRIVHDMMANIVFHFARTLSSARIKGAAGDEGGRRATRLLDRPTEILSGPLHVHSPLPRSPPFPPFSLARARFVLPLALQKVKRGSFFTSFRWAGGFFFFAASGDCHLRRQGLRGRAHD